LEAGLAAEASMVSAENAQLLKEKKTEHLALLKAVGA
jgi:hypothetical protein